MCSGDDAYVLSYVSMKHLKPPGSCDLCEQKPNTSLPICQPPAIITKLPHKLRKIHQPLINMHQEVDNNSQVLYNSQRTPTEQAYVSSVSSGTEAAL
jgi:hypothetical protein